VIASNRLFWFVARTCVASRSARRRFSRSRRLPAADSRGRRDPARPLPTLPTYSSRCGSALRSTAVDRRPSRCGLCARKRNVGPISPARRSARRSTRRDSSSRLASRAAPRCPAAGCPPARSVRIDRRQPHDERLAISGGSTLTIPRPVGTEIQMERAQRLLRQLVPGNSRPPGARRRRERTVRDRGYRSRRRTSSATQRSSARNSARVAASSSAGEHGAADMPRRCSTRGGNGPGPCRRGCDHVDRVFAGRSASFRSGRTVCTASRRGLKYSEFVNRWKISARFLFLARPSRLSTNPRRPHPVRDYIYHTTRLGEQMLLRNTDLFFRHLGVAIA